VITVSDGLPERQNIITACAAEKNDVIFFRKRQACVQAEVGPLKSTYGFWRGAISSKPRGSRAKPRRKSNIWNTAWTDTAAVNQQTQVFGEGSQVMGQEFF